MEKPIFIQIRLGQECRDFDVSNASTETEMKMVGQAAMLAADTVQVVEVGPEKAEFARVDCVGTDYTATIQAHKIDSALRLRKTLFGIGEFYVKIAGLSRNLSAKRQPVLASFAPFILLWSANVNNFAFLVIFCGLLTAALWSKDLWRDDPPPPTA